MINYKVLLHYTRRYSLGGLEYCDIENSKKAQLITVFLEGRTKETYYLEHIDSERDFPNSKQGMNEAILYAEKLSKKYNTSWDQY